MTSIRASPDDRLHAPRTDLPPFDLSLLQPLGWNGVDIRVESMGPTRLPHSVQHYMSLHLSAQQHFDVLLDDDGPGEAADLVGITSDEVDITVTLVHCKYSSEETPGARVGDLYEVCGQAARGAKWREYGIEALLRRLDRRAAKYAARNPGRSPYLIGSIDDAVPHPRTRTPSTAPHQHRHRPARTLSSRVQQRLLAGAHSYVRALTKGTFTVYRSS